MPVGRDSGTYPRLLECTCLHFGRAGSHRGLPERYPFKAKLTGREYRVLTEGCSDVVLTPSSRRESSKALTAKKEQIHRGGRDSVQLEDLDRARASWVKDEPPLCSLCAIRILAIIIQGF